MSKIQTRGVRNNNPGNIKKTNDPWQGLKKYQSDPVFFQFEKPIYGIRAIARILINYQDSLMKEKKENGISINYIVNKWAPPIENQTSNYINFIKKQNGFISENITLDMHDFDKIFPIVKAIIHFENGYQPYDDQTIEYGLRLAGVEKSKEKSLLKDDAVKGGQVATIAGTGAGIIEVLQSQIPSITQSISPYADSIEYAKWFMFGLTIFGGFLVIYSKIKDKRKGII